jgi:shikimate dehydrogenase
MKTVYGLIGRNISYSFSRTYFSEKFRRLGLEHCNYVNFDLEKIEDLESIVLPRLNEIGGLNVTIPYKEEVMKYLHDLDPEAKSIGAVNTIKVFADGKLKGYNTDAFGFESALGKLLGKQHRAALILGTGGASKAVAHVFGKRGIEYRFVSRGAYRENALKYSDLDEEVMKTHQVIVNCTPLGTFPDTERKPDIPYELIDSSHLLFDLIYNPEKTSFLLEGERRGAKILNGREMLERQADRAWEIWNS